MARRLGVFAGVMLAVLLAGGCAHKQAAQAAPAAGATGAAGAGAEPRFVVDMWDGKALDGTVGWLADGAVRVGNETVAEKDIRLIHRVMENGGAGTVDLAKLPTDYQPLSQEELARYRQRAEAAAEKYKGSDYIFCLDRAENVYRPDGTQHYYYHALYLVLKESGRGVANLDLGFQQGRSSARVLFSRSVAVDGRQEWSDDSTFTVSTPPQSRQFVDTRSRVISGQVPGAAPGVLIEYAMEIEDYNPEVKEFFFPGYSFQGEKPVLDSTIDVLVPKDRKLNYTTLNMPAAAAAPVESARGEFRAYRWEMRDVPPITPEPSMPELSDVVARMQGSLYFDWKELMAPTGRFQRERIEATPEIKALAARLTEGRPTDDARLAALYHWVQRNIKYLSIKASLASGWAGHPASQTLKQGYGDCTDVSVLFASLARAAGIDAYPAVIKTNDAGTAVTDVPVPDANHAITLVYPDGKPRFLDVTAEDYRYPYLRSDDHGVKAVIYMKEEITRVPVGAPEDNMRVSRQEVKMLPDGGARVKEINLYTGTYEAGVRGYWRSVPPEMRGRLMQQYIQSRAPGSALDGFELSDMDDLDVQLSMEMDYHLQSLATIMRDLYIFTLPNFAVKFPEASLAQRTYPLKFDTTQCYDTVVNVALPEGYVFAGAPKPLKVEGRYLSFDGSVTPSPDGRSVSVRQLFKRLAQEVPAADYQSYRNDSAAIAAWTDLKVVLRKDAGTSATETAGTASAIEATAKEAGK